MIVDVETSTSAIVDFSSEPPADSLAEPVADSLRDESEQFFTSSKTLDKTAPLGASNIPTADTDLWRTLRDSLQLDHRIDEKRVQQEIRWMQNHPEYWERLAPRMQRYLPYILSQVTHRELPAELALLPIIESALDPYAFSPYGASGLWQFMRPTAKQYGLNINSHYDGRRDVIASTQAALDFLQDLHRRFDNWPLALAAYNAGGGTVSKSVRRGKTKDFFALRLPRETQAYVPRLLAISAIAADPETYNIALPSIKNRDPLRVLMLESAFDVAVVAQTLDLKIADIYAYNPALKRSQWSADNPLRLVLPESYAAHKSAKDASELLHNVATVDRVTWRDILVARGDTLSEIAAAYDTTSQSLIALNGLPNDRLQIGQSLRVPGPSRLTRPVAKGTHPYTVRPGDSLWKIAKQGGFEIGTLVKLNNIGRRDVLRVGQILVVPASQNSHTATQKPPSEIRKINYRVRRGDSLSRIAQRFRIRVSDIVGWNGITPDGYLQPGQGLTLYVDVIAG